MTIVTRQPNNSWPVVMVSVSPQMGLRKMKIVTGQPNNSTLVVGVSPHMG